MSRNPNSFGLVGDLDDVETIQAAEEVFGIRIEDAEAERVRTFGDFLDLVEGKLSPVAPSICLLRRDFADLRERASAAGLPPLRPSLALDALGEEVPRVLTLLDSTKERSRAERLREWLAVSPLVAMVLAVPVGIAWTMAGWVGLAALAGLAVVAFIGHLLRPRPVEPRTVADLLRASFHRRYSDLARRHGPGRPSDRRQALESLCREMSGYAGPVNRDTTFFSHHFPEGAR